MTRTWISRACAWSLLALVACSGQRESEDGERVRERRAGLPVLPTDSAQRAADAALRSSWSTRQPGELSTVTAEPVVGWSGPGGQPFEVTLRTHVRSTDLYRRFGTITMHNALRDRSPDLHQYPCTSCHYGRTVRMEDQRIADAHQNIRVEHPQQTGALCSTCHSPDNVESLALKSGERASLDHAYRLCAQCHFRQAESWAGGAHGKRLDGWQGRRVVMGCADCHNPHHPQTDPRIPFRAPRIERTEASH